MFALRLPNTDDIPSGDACSIARLYHLFQPADLRYVFVGRDILVRHDVLVWFDLEFRPPGEYRLCDLQYELRRPGPR